MEKMRENLPAYYEQILKEKMERVATNEADIQVSYAVVLIAMSSSQYCGYRLDWICRN